MRFITSFVNRFRRALYPSEEQMVANRLYNVLVAQARQPVFFTSGQVPDTIDGRFDMIALHAFLVMYRLKDKGDAAKSLSQALFDEMFFDMDRALREMGVGDVGIGRRVRAMGKAFMGRVEVYDAALKGLPGDLEAALGRNVYRGAEVPQTVLARMAEYMRDQAQALAAQPLEALLAGDITFSPMLNEDET